MGLPFGQYGGRVVQRVRWHVLLTRDPTTINVLTCAKAFQRSVHESPFPQRARAIPG